MADFNKVKKDIVTNVFENTEQLIKGDPMQKVLLEMIGTSEIADNERKAIEKSLTDLTTALRTDTNANTEAVTKLNELLEDGAVFKGLAKPGQRLVCPAEQNAFWFANQAGDYIGGGEPDKTMTMAEEGLNVITHKASGWSILPSNLITISQELGNSENKVVSQAKINECINSINMSVDAQKAIIYGSFYNTSGNIQKDNTDTYRRFPLFAVNENLYITNFNILNGGIRCYDGKKKYLGASYDSDLFPGNTEYSFSKEVKYVGIYWKKSTDDYNNAKIEAGNSFFNLNEDFYKFKDFAEKSFSPSVILNDKKSWGIFGVSASSGEIDSNAIDSLTSKFFLYLRDGATRLNAISIIENQLFDSISYWILYCYDKDYTYLGYSQNTWDNIKGKYPNTKYVRMTLRFSKGGEQVYPTEEFTNYLIFNNKQIQNVFISNKFKDIEEDTNTLAENILNLSERFDISKYIIYGSYYSQSGMIVNAPETIYRRLPLIKHNKDFYFKINSSLYPTVRCYNEKQEFISDALLVDVVEGKDYYHCNLAKGTAYFGMFWQSKEDRYEGSWFDSSFYKYVNDSIIKFDQIDNIEKYIIYNSYYSPSGTPVSLPNSKYRRLPYLEVHKDFYFKISSSLYPSVRCYNHSLDFLGTSEPELLPNKDYYKCTILEGTKFVGIYWQSNLDDYSSCWFNSKVWKEIDDLSLDLRAIDTVLKDKKWYFAGDSFSAGLGLSEFEDEPFKGMKKTYPYYIARRTGCIPVADAISGSTMTYIDGTHNEYSTTNGRYTKIPLDVDYITFYFGINDFNFSAPIGTIDDKTNKTFYGAWNVILTEVIKTHPLAKIGIIVTNGSTSDYTNAERKIAKKYGLSFIDLELDDKIPYFLRQAEKAEKQGIPQEIIDIRTNTYAIDPPGNTHPKEIAHEFESSFIESWLKSI